MRKFLTLWTGKLAELKEAGEIKQGAKAQLALAS